MQQSWRMMSSSKQLEDNLMPTLTIHNGNVQKEEKQSQWGGEQEQESLREHQLQVSPIEKQHGWVQMFNVNM